MGVEHVDGITGESAVEHIFDGVGSFFGLGYDDRVEACAVDELEPSHVELGGGRAAPLASFEEDYADGTVGEALGFEEFDELALRASEDEEDIVATAFAFDVDESGGPEREVVERA